MTAYSLDLSRVDKIGRTYDLAALFPELSGPFTAASVALLPPRSAPTGSTVWASVTVTSGQANVLYAGPDADSTGAVVVTGNCDPWIEATSGTETQAVRVPGGRITLRGGGTVIVPPTLFVSSVQGRTGAVVLSASDVGALPKWKPSTAYTAGDLILNPTGQIVSANATFTSGASYSAGNWTVVTGGTGNALLAANNLSDVASASAARTNLGLGTAATQASTAFDAAGAASAAQTAATTAAATDATSKANAAQAAAIAATSLPDRTGQAGKVLGTDGTALSWVAGGGSGVPAAANAVAVLGTSITAANAPYDQGGGSIVDTGAGYFHWTNMFLRQSMKLVLQGGVSGDTTGGMLARIGTVLSSGARLCVVETGPNDVQGDSTVTNITTSLTSIYQQLNAAGILVAACHIYPTTTIMANTSRRTVMHRVNRWITDYARSHPGVILVPWAGAVSDPSTGGPLAGTLFDGTHPNTYGAALLGSKLADALEEWVVGAPDLPYTNGDLTNGLSNGLMLGNTSGVATGWTMNPSGGAVYSASKVTRQDGDPGEWQQIALSSGTCGIYADAAAGPAWSVGSPAVAMFEVDGDATNLTSLQVIIQSYNGTTFQQSAAALTDFYTSANRVPISRGVIQSHPITPPAGATSLRAYIEFAGSGVMRVGRAAVRSVAL
jgi:lysophospholipase L1-like esterase